MRLVVEDLIIKSGLKKRHIANEIGINENTLTNWMKNRSWPKLNQAVDLADILKCDVNDLYERTD